MSCSVYQIYHATKYVTDTSRPIRAGEKDGCGYWFTSREKMDEDIANHKYLEYGEYEKHLYGTKLDSIRQVMRLVTICDYREIFENF